MKLAMEKYRKRIEKEKEKKMVRKKKFFHLCLDEEM